MSRYGRNTRQDSVRGVAERLETLVVDETHITARTDGQRWVSGWMLGMRMRSPTKLDRGMEGLNSKSASKHQPLLSRKKKYYGLG